MRSEQNRRDVLAIIGTGTLSTVGSVGAVAGSGKEEFVGIQYETFSKDVTGKASAKLVTTGNGEIRGTFDFGQGKVPINSKPVNRTPMEKVSGGPDDGYKNRYTASIRGEDDKHVKNGRPLDVTAYKITRGEVSGIVRHSQSDKRAFLLENKSESKKTESEIRESLKEKVKKHKLKVTGTTGADTSSRETSSDSVSTLSTDECDIVDGKKKTFVVEGGSDEGEFAAFLQGNNGRFGGARGFEISAEYGFNRFHIHDWWPDTPTNPCYPSSNVAALDRRYFRISGEAQNTDFDEFDPNYSDVDGSGDYSSPSFSISYSPLPFVSVGASVAVDMGFGSGSSFQADPYEYAEWDLEGGTASTDKSESDGVKFNIVNKTKSPYSNLTVNMEAQNDYNYVCGRGLVHSSTPLIEWDATMVVVE